MPIMRNLPGLILALAWLSSCSALPPQARAKSSFWKYVRGLPELKPLPPGKTYELSVAYVHDGTLAGPTEPELRAVFNRTQTLARRLLGVRVRLRLNRRLPVRRFWSERKHAFKDPIFSYPARFWYISPLEPNLKQRIRGIVAAAIKGKSARLLAQYFGPRRGSQSEYVNQITDRFVSRLRALHAEPDRQSRPLYSTLHRQREQYLSFAHWDTLMYAETEFDFIVTNLVIAMPDTGMPVYVINRGGVTTAFVENNAHRPYGGAGVLTLYPFWSTGPFFQRERGPLNTQERIDAAAVMWVHELGHLLLRKKEDYSLQGSVHRAPTGLRYREWMRQILRSGRSQSKRVGTLKRF